VAQDSERLENELKQVERENGSLKEMSAELEKANLEFEEQQRVLTVDLVESRNKLAETVKSLSALEKANKKLEGDINDLHTRLKDETNGKNTANNNVASLAAAKKKLAAELDKANKGSEELVAAKARLESELQKVKKQLVEEQDFKIVAEEVRRMKNQEIFKLETEKKVLEAQLQDALSQSKERQAIKEAKKKLGLREYLKFQSVISSAVCTLSFESSGMKRNQKQHLVMCNWSGSSIVEWDPQTSQILNSIQLDSKPHSIAIDNEDNQWIVCSDRTVRKRQREGPQFVIQFTLDRSDTMQFRIGVTKKGKIVIGSSLYDSIYIWEQTTTSEGWFWNTTTNLKWTRTQRVTSSFDSNFDELQQIVVDSRDRIIVCDEDNNRVVVLTDELKDVIDLSAQFKFHRPCGVAVDERNNVFVAEWDTKRVVVFDEEGNHLNTFKHSLECVYYVEVIGDSIYVKNNNSIEELKIK